jgi:hypothetical protein
LRARPRLLFDRDLRHSGRQEDPDRNVNTPLTQAYHPTVGIHIRFRRRRHGPIGGAGVGDSLAPLSRFGDCRRVRSSVDELEVVRLDGCGRAPCFVNQSRSDEFQVCRVQSVKGRN